MRCRHSGAQKPKGRSGHRPPGSLTTTTARGKIKKLIRFPRQRDRQYGFRQGGRSPEESRCLAFVFLVHIPTLARNAAWTAAVLLVVTETYMLTHGDEFRGQILGFVVLTHRSLRLVD